MKLIRRIILAVIILVIVVVGVITLWGFNMYKEAVDKVSISESVEKIKTMQNYTKLEDITKEFKDAIVAVEDHRFYEHSGIDIITTARSMIQNIEKKDIVAGGSSITQQIGRQMYFTQEQRFTRKVAELFVAMDLEKEYSKDDILELYINKIYYGDGYYGIYAASKGYYNKLPSELTLSEASMLAGLPNAPSVYAPTKNPDLAKKRQANVLAAMVKYSYITEEQREEIIK